MDLPFTIDDAVAAKLAAAMRLSLGDEGAALTDRQVLRRVTRRYWKSVYLQAETATNVNAVHAQLKAARDEAETATSAVFGPDE